MLIVKVLENTEVGRWDPILKNQLLLLFVYTKNCLSLRAGQEQNEECLYVTRSREPEDRETT